MQLAESAGADQRLVGKFDLGEIVGNVRELARTRSSPPIS
jgi:hypothetical protein